MQLYIGNKNYSSWSLRPWLLMKHLGIDFEEIRLRLDVEDGSAFKAALSGISPSGKVPVLVDDDGFAVWESLAIVEYLAEKFPQAAVWPAAAKARARARCLCAEMHSGLAALRNHFPMNIEASLPDVGERVLREVPQARADVERIAAMWTGQLASNDGGAFLFGEFSAADAYFAPVCSRITTYRLPMPAAAGDYVQRMISLPAMQAWTADAVAENDFLPFDEPYRSKA